MKHRYAMLSSLALAASPCSCSLAACISSSAVTFSVQVGMEDGVVLGQEHMDTDFLCASLEALLRHGLRPGTPRDAWASYLATTRSAPLDMLHEASKLAPEPRVKGWGLEGVRASAAAHGDAAALQMWIRSSLNDQALGARVYAIANCRPLLEAWYSE